MKILVIDEEFPFPLNTGKRIRSFNLARALTAFHDVSYLAYGLPGSDAFRFLQKNRITPFPVDPPYRQKSGTGFYFRLLLNLLSPLPYIVTSHYSRAFKERLKGLLKEDEYDIVICEWTPYAVFLRDLPAVKKIIVAHNIESRIWQRYQSEEKNPLKRLYIAIQRGKIERFERKCFHWANGATAVSDNEAHQIENFGVDYRVEVVENGVDVDYFSPREDEIDPDMVVFTGSMDWRPNQDAVAYFVTEILPHIKKKKLSIKVFLVGRNPSKSVLRLGRLDGVNVTGTVDDVRPYMVRAGAYVVPLRIGGGSRVKILEALAMMKPVVSTSIGAEGLRVKHGEEIIISDEPEKFAEAVVNCLEDSDLSRRIGANGRMLVEKYYRWEELGKKYNDYIISVVNQR
jgi:sugar transferase (PEP-CTERM/EpsH1 system associated)